ncbi:MAG TPA: amidase family protein, partial [Chloroflexota bacterium]|nr:amidase family protein [Chloroflexota bacterium]
MIERDSELGRLMARLRANLDMAGIPATDDDLRDFQDQGYPASLANFEHAIAGVVYERQPDIPVHPPANSTEPSQPFGAVVPLDRAPADRRPTPPDFGVEDPLAFASAREVAVLLRERRLSSVELTTMALDRIAKRDPALNAFQVVLADQALAAAREMDREIGQGRYRGPYHGVPVAVKDLLAMRGTATYAGSSEPWPGFNTLDSA